jgi:hypothetical protein
MIAFLGRENGSSPFIKHIWQNSEKINTDIRDPSGIRTLDPSVEIMLYRNCRNYRLI